MEIIVSDKSKDLEHKHVEISKQGKEKEIFSDVNIPKNEENQQKATQSTSNSIKDIFLNKKDTNQFLSSYCKEFYDKFELLDLIKHGSAGAVYQGRLRNMNSKEIAFKFLFDNTKETTEKKINEKNKKDKKDKKEKGKHLEISIHGILKNKHIPEIYGYYKIQNSSCIAMEFTKYGDIENFKRKILKRSVLSESLVLYIGGGIIEALHYLHSKNKIIHMDIKQQNVLIDDFLMIKLTDFSVSINYQNLKDHITLPMVGTCYYMSPEVLNKETILKSEASKIDIYSLGALLYLLAFCDYPYNLNEVDNKNYPQIAKNIKEKELKFPEDTGHSKLFLNFLRKCLNKNIKERYDINQVMEDPWFKGYQIILNEKEKLYNAGKFVIDLMVDNLMPFNNYLKQQENALKQ